MSLECKEEGQAGYIYVGWMRSPSERMPEERSAKLRPQRYINVDKWETEADPTKKTQEQPER